MGIPKGAKVWLPNRRDGNGRYFHRDPDGRRWYGTPAEVREAVLMPWRRDMLARELRFIRSYAEDYGTDRETLAEWAKSKRRDAIQAGLHDSGGVSVTIPAATYIRLVAGARLVRDNFDEYLAELWNAEISAFLEVAESDTCKREIPMTRHELAALDKLRKSSE
jgi:hypothetical protein